MSRPRQIRMIKTNVKLPVKISMCELSFGHESDKVYWDTNLFAVANGIRYVGSSNNSRSF